jgi:hypothetical protein
MLLGVSLELVGYITRNLRQDAPFVKDNLILYLTIARAFISAGIYICLSRIIVHYAPTLSKFKPVWYAIGFYCSDLASLILQGAGGALDSTAET